MSTTQAMLRARAALVPEHWTRARAASVALFRAGFAPVVTGSLAAWLHGAELAPADVDLEVPLFALAQSAGRADRSLSEERTSLHAMAASLHSGPPKVDVVTPGQGAECPVPQWVWLDGVAIVGALYVTVRALARVAALVRGYDVRNVHAADLGRARDLAAVHGVDALDPGAWAGFRPALELLAAGCNGDEAVRALEAVPDDVVAKLFSATPMRGVQVIRPTAPRERNRSARPVLSHHNPTSGRSVALTPRCVPWP